MRPAPGRDRQMPTACRAKRVLRDRCKWNPRGYIRFRVRNRFPRVDRLLKSQAASHAACWIYKFLLPSYLSVRQHLRPALTARLNGNALTRQEVERAEDHKGAGAMTFAPNAANQGEV